MRRLEPDYFELLVVVVNVGFESSSLHFFQFFNPFISPRKNSSDYRVHGFQNDRLDIKQNVPKIRSPNQTCIILDVLANISGPGAYFSKPIFALKPWVQAGRFEYHEPYNQKNFFSDL